jgi:CheY-like chemotaxis protein
MLPALVVEDHNINRDVAILQLKALGLDAHWAASGVEAVEAVKKQSFSIILMDVMMPDLDGWEACRQIREYEQTTGIRTPIIGVSAWAGADNKKKCLLAGMDEYLSKPYSREDLKAIVERFINLPV